ncbi:spoIIAA-like fold containing protein [Synechococcus sp. BIOS-E4-1]|nr:spoIIAA-like fold containing protein [Synechococcus sp. BIOS-E4-1]
MQLMPMSVSALHGFTLEAVELAPVPVITVLARGRLTHEDYLSLIPQLQAAIDEQTSDRLRLVFDARELWGWELRAALDDLRLSIRHGLAVERVALITDARWLSLLSRLAGLLMPGQIRSFREREAGDAWVRS